MVIGIALLLVVGLFIYFGLLQRILDSLYLTDRNAFLIIFFLIIGSFVDIRVNKTPVISINIGGALIPILLAVYVFVKSDSVKERLRSLAAIFLTGGLMYIASTFFRDFTLPRNDFIDTSLLFAIIAGVFGYIFGRSRRGAFIASVGGILIYNTITALNIVRLGQPTAIRLGGAGVFDSFVISSFLALGLTELYGELVEGLVRKKEAKGPHSSSFDNHLVSNAKEEADDHEK